MINKLYGDGVHDDHPAIQEMLDSGVSLVYLPVPEKNYVISSTLRLHSNQELRLDRFTKISLADGANCLMLSNAEQKEGNKNIKISGGIWDMNHNNQDPNPWHFPSPRTGKTSYQLLEEMGWRNPLFAMSEEEKRNQEKLNDSLPEVYSGHCMAFENIHNFYIGSITILNPVVYGMDLYKIVDFTVEDIEFEYTEGSPKLWNLDGVHIEGYCKNGYVRNLKGACHDDAVALTSDDASKRGPIENITIDGVYTQGCHSAVRLLSRVNPVKNVHITNIYGTYYAYCIVMSKYSDLPERSGFENINIDNVYASLCPGTVDVPGNRRPLVWIGDEIDIKNVSISNFHRNETHNPMPTVGIEKGSFVESLSISDTTQTNETDRPMVFLKNEGTIKNLYLKNIETAGDELISGSGKIIRKNIC